jgi:hypothetical protein
MVFSNVFELVNLLKPAAYRLCAFFSTASRMRKFSIGSGKPVSTDRRKDQRKFREVMQTYTNFTAKKLVLHNVWKKIFCVTARMSLRLNHAQCAFPSHFFLK